MSVPKYILAAPPPRKAVEIMLCKTCGKLLQNTSKMYLACVDNKPLHGGLVEIGQAAAMIAHHWDEVRHLSAPFVIKRLQQAIAHHGLTPKKK